MARLSKERFALRGSIVILGAWVLFFLAGPIADAIGLALATLIFVPIFAGQAIRSFRSDDPARKRTAAIALSLSVLALAPPILHFSRMFF